MGDSHIITQSHSGHLAITVEPPNKGHIGTRGFVFYREVSFIWRLKYTSIIGIGTSGFVLYREVFFIQNVLYRRFHCIISIVLSISHIIT